MACDSLHHTVRVGLSIAALGLFLSLSGCKPDLTDEQRAAQIKKIMDEEGPIRPFSINTGVVEIPVPQNGAVGAGSFLVPFLQRQPDCSLTEHLVDLFDQRVVRSNSNIQRDLHRRTGLSTTSDVFARGCVDPETGVASQLGVIAGVLPDGGYYGAVLGDADSGVIRVGIVDAVDGLRSMQELVVRPEGSQLDARSLASADFDGDGRDTLIVALGVRNQGIGAIALAQPKANGSFGKPSFIDLPFEVAGVTVADFDGDRRLDIAATGAPSNFDDPGLAILSGRSGGTFAKPRLIPGSIFASSLIAADFNGDRHMDLATDSGRTLLGIGGGRFAAPITLRSPGGQPVAGDFNQDGRVDIALVLASINQITIFHGLGDGRFVEGATYASIIRGRHLVTTDVDGDGNLDLVVGYSGKGLYAPFPQSGGNVQFLLGRGDGTFAGVPVRPGGVPLLADFNNDRKPDLLTTAGFFKGRGGVSFASPKPALKPGFVVSDTIATDFNGDGKLDLLGISVNSGISDGLSDLLLRLGRGDGTFEDSGPVTPLTLVQENQTFAARRHALALGDFDGDRLRDVALIGSTTRLDPGSRGALIVLRNTGKGSLGAPATISSNLVNPVDIAVATVDEGNTVDIVVVERGNDRSNPPLAGSVRVYRGRGDRRFMAPQTLRPLRHPEALAVADIDADGHADLLVAGESGEPGSPLRSLAVLRGTGKGFRAAMVTPLVERFIYGITTGDINGDGKLDLALAGIEFNTYLIGKGNGRFQPEALLPVPIAGRRPRLVDLNGDRRAEWIVEAAGGTVVLQNTGTQTP